MTEFRTQPEGTGLILRGAVSRRARVRKVRYAYRSLPRIKSATVAVTSESIGRPRHRASEEWLAALAPLGTDENKPFLEKAPYLIAIFSQKYGLLPDGRKVKHYYPTESVGIATGILVTGLHRAGLVTLRHTPSPMKFLNEILDRPDNERPFLLLVVGYPAEDAMVPDISRKRLDEIATFL